MSLTTFGQAAPSRGTSSMNGSFFLDTNILIYTFDDRSPAKKDQARELVARAFEDRTGLISSQVVQEFLNVAGSKFEKPLSHEDLRLYLDRVLMPLCQVYPSADLYHRALDVSARWRYGFYDSLIVAAALEAGCVTLLSEDLQHGQRIEGLSVVDPFR